MGEEWGVRMERDEGVPVHARGRRSAPQHPHQGCTVCALLALPLLVLVLALVQAQLLALPTCAMRFPTRAPFMHRLGPPQTPQRVCPG